MVKGFLMFVRKWFNFSTSYSYFGKNFDVYIVGEFDNDDNKRVLLALMILILLVRRRS